MTLTRAPRSAATQAADRPKAPAPRIVRSAIALPPARSYGATVDQRTANGEGLTWRDGVPVSARYDDPYYSLGDGLAEARHVFLAGNGLPGRFRPGFRIAELGFGTGLNALAALIAWRGAGMAGPLRFTSFEAAPLDAGQMTRALSAFPDLADTVPAFVAAVHGGPPLPDLDLTVIAGDARRTLPDWGGQADAWFLDGFAPARNPELWEPSLLAHVRRTTTPGGTAATYSAAGAVRRALSDAGFAVDRRPGHGRKRHMTVATAPGAA